MHVCLVHRDLHEVTRGGICTVYRALAARLAARGHHVTLLTQATPQPVQLPGIVVVSVPRTDDLAVHRRSVAEALAHIRPDVVDCSTWEAETLAYLQQPPALRAPILVRGDLSAATMNAPGLAADERELLRLAGGRRLPSPRSPQPTSAPARRNSAGNATPRRAVSASTARRSCAASGRWVRAISTRSTRSL